MVASAGFVLLWSSKRGRMLPTEASQVCIVTNVLIVKFVMLRSKAQCTTRGRMLHHGLSIAKRTTSGVHGLSGLLAAIERCFLHRPPKHV